MRRTSTSSSSSSSSSPSLLPTTSGHELPLLVLVLVLVCPAVVVGRRMRRIVREHICALEVTRKHEEGGKVLQSARGEERRQPNVPRARRGVLALKYELV